MNENQRNEVGGSSNRRGWRGAFERCMEDARQALFPGPFQIHSPIDGSMAADPLAECKENDGRFSEVDNPAGELRQVLQTMAAVATALWRARTKLASEATNELPAELRHLPRHIQAAWDALEAGGIQIQDHKDQRYVPGMAVTPITFQPMAGIGCEVIQETLKPSVFFRDSLIQRADVIVAKPLGDEATAKASEDMPPVSPPPKHVTTPESGQDQGSSSSAV